MSLIKADPTKVRDIANTKRSDELKQLLADSDYKVLPDYDKTNDSITIQRQSWREELRSREAV